jgi:hypothetical protein
LRRSSLGLFLPLVCNIFLLFLRGFPFHVAFKCFFIAGQDIASSFCPL